jgi:hypothetical protein
VLIGARNINRVIGKIKGRNKKIYNFGIWNIGWALEEQATRRP